MADIKVAMNAIIEADEAYNDMSQDVERFILKHLDRCEIWKAPAYDECISHWEQSKCNHALWYLGDARELSFKLGRGNNGLALKQSAWRREMQRALQRRLAVALLDFA